MHLTLNPPQSSWSKEARAGVGRLWDLRAPQVDALFELVDDPTCWLLGPTPGSFLIRVPPGPALRGSQAWFLRLSPGARYQAPPGRMLVLRGDLRAEAGAGVEAGALIEGAGGAFTNPARRECVCCVVAAPVVEGG